MPELYRNRKDTVIHEKTCRHARLPWQWADNKTAAEIDLIVREFGYWYCGKCLPKGPRAISDPIDLVAALKGSFNDG